MNILVTGGAGFIGSHTVVALHEAGFKPVIIDDFSNSDRLVLGGLAQIIGYEVPVYDRDCGDAAVLKQIFTEHQIEGVIHFAAFKAVGESMLQPLKYYRNNLGSMITLLEVMLEHGISNLIFSSSCTVYGSPDQLPVTEETPVQPAISVYGNTKQIGEEILRDTIAANNPLKINALRYFNPVGAHPSGLIGELPIGVPANLIPFVTQTAAGLRAMLTVFGTDYETADGSCIRDYIHVMDLAEAHVAALRKLIQMPTGISHYDVYNIGTGNGNSVLEIIHTFEEISGQALPYKIGDRREGDIPAIFADVTKSKTGLGWQASRTLREGLTDAWRWQQQLANKQTHS
jgi:UDP-glucose 4-epimerase